MEETVRGMGNGRVAIVGMGGVGACTAYVAMQLGRVRELLLVDKVRARAEGHMLDLVHCLPYGRPFPISVRETGELEDCAVIIITAGAAQDGSHRSRMDLLHANARIVTEIMEQTAPRNPRALYILITNPVDVMTRVAQKVSGLPARQVIGTGTVLDSARFRMVLAQHFAVDPRNVHAYVIGEHGDSEVAVWSRVSIGPYTVGEYGKLCGRELGAADRERITVEVRRAAYEIIERKGLTSFAIGVSTQRILESVAQDQSTIQTVSRALSGCYGLQDVCMSLPCLIDETGAADPMEFPLDVEERAALMRSAEVLEDAYRKLGF